MFVKNFMHIAGRRALFVRFLVDKSLFLRYNIIHTKTCEHHRRYVMAVKINKKKLVDARGMRDLTQAELALVAGVSRKTLSDLENGYTGISLDNISKIAKALRIKVSDILIG